VRVKDELVEKVLALTAKIVVGDPFDPKTTMGPLNNEGVAAKMDRHVADAIEKGARVLAGGGRAKHLPTSLYYQPTIRDGVTADMAVNREESFGPIVPILTFSTMENALALAMLNLCVWVKTNGGMGSLYRSRHELVFVFAKRGAKRVNNVQLGRYGRNRTNVWTYPGMNSFARRGRTRGLDLHPTVKPIAMVSDAILDVTQRGDVVLDPFCGSGTTMLATSSAARRCRLRTPMVGLMLPREGTRRASSRWTI
jgi:hypothetical protein